MQIRGKVPCIQLCALVAVLATASDADAQYSGYVEILQGSVVCRQGMLGNHPVRCSPTTPGSRIREM